MTDSTDFSPLEPVIIVGGDGAMGKFFRTLLSERNIRCSSIELDTPHEERVNLLKDAGTVIIAVPIAATVEVINEIIPHLAAGTLLSDITSIKEAPLKAMMKHGGEVLGLHPMCGPSGNSLAGQVVVSCPGRKGPRSELFIRLLEACGSKTVELGAAQHDRLMAVVQGLNHFQSITFAHALGKLGIPVEDTLSVASPVYLLRIQLMGRILAQSAELYTDIELQNPYVPATLEALENSAGEFLKTIREGDRDGCIQFFEQAATAFGTWRTTALTESDELLTALQSRKAAGKIPF